MRSMVEGAQRRFRPLWLAVLATSPCTGEEPICK